MYISITKPERDTFLQQTKDCLMPGSYNQEGEEISQYFQYQSVPTLRSLKERLCFSPDFPFITSVMLTLLTAPSFISKYLSKHLFIDPWYTGHCPTLKFRFGKRYGASTKEIIREMGEKGMWARHISNTRYRENDPVKGLLDGGYIPGMNFIYGKSYIRAADESMSKFEMRKAALECKKEFEGPHRNYERKFQKLQQTYPEDKLRAAILDFDKKYRYKEEHISPEQPPIAGYTGHIPRIKSTETSLSQRYHTAAKRGLYLLQQERQKHQNGIESIPTPVY